MRIGLDNIIAYYCDMWDETRKTRLQAIRKLFPEIPDDAKYALAGWMKMHTNPTFAIRRGEKFNRLIIMNKF